LFLAVNTAFNGFPVLGSVLARNKFLPEYMKIRGDRLAYSNGIIILMIASILTVYISKAQVSSLIHLYVIGVFVSFTLSQLSMIIHWTKKLRVLKNPVYRRKVFLSRIINVIGFVLTLTVFVIIIATKFLDGAWISVFVIILLFLFMNKINQYYKKTSRRMGINRVKKINKEDVTPQADGEVDAIILASEITKDLVVAMKYATELSSHGRVEVLHVATEETTITDQLEELWDKSDIDIPLKILKSPFRHITPPILEYVKAKRKKNPNGIIVVYVLEHIEGKWYQNLFHNQTAIRLKNRLRNIDGVVVTSMAFKLDA
jgi:hypothetical protein